MSPILAGLASSIGLRRDAANVFRGMPAFVRDLYLYRREEARNARSNFPIRYPALRPCLADRFRESADIDLHYFYQDIWVAERILRRQPLLHVDVGSRVDGFVAHLLCSREVEVVDIRPLAVSHSNLRFRRGDLLSLPYADDSLESVSCLHTLEHVGLGRYGDAIDVWGHRKALAELQRVVSPGGYLYVSAPIGRERVEFNAHRVLDPMTLVCDMEGFELESHAVVTDEGRLREDVDPRHLGSSRYACGIFEFRRMFPAPNAMHGDR